MGIGAACVCGAAVLVLLVTSSLWFLFALLPETGKEARRIGYEDAALAFTGSRMREAVRKTIPVPEESITNVRSIVYQQDDRGETVIVIPRLSAQTTVRSRLDEDGWVSRRLGLIVIAYKSSGQGVNAQGVRPIRALGKVFQKVALQRLPLHPQAAFQLISSDSNGQSVAMYAQKNQGGIHGVISLQQGNFLPGTRGRTEGSYNSQETSFVSLQSDILSIIPNNFQAILETALAKDLGFQKTSPAILSDLLAIGPVTIAKRGEESAVGMFSEDSAIAERMNTWIAAEQSVRHPQRRAFALPDNTIGYEYIPGKVETSFSLNEGKNNCFPSRGYDEQVFLCGQGNAVVFADEEKIGDELVSFLQVAKRAWRGNIQGELLHAMGIEEGIKAIEYAGDENGIEVWIDRIVEGG